MRNLSSCFTVALFFVSIPAFAETEASSASSARTEAKANDPVRLRIGVAGGGTLGFAKGDSSTESVSALGVGPSLLFNIGVQFNRHWALYAQASGASVIASSQGSAYGIVEFTPTRLLSIGTGVGYDAMGLFWVGDCVDNCVRNSWSGVSVPLVLGLNLLDEDGWNGGARHAPLRIHWSGALGIEPSSGILGTHFGFAIGKEWM